MQPCAASQTRCRWVGGKGGGGSGAALPARGAAAPHLASQQEQRAALRGAGWALTSAPKSQLCARFARWVQGVLNSVSDEVFDAWTSVTDPEEPGEAQVPGADGRGGRGGRGGQGRDVKAFGGGMWSVCRQRPPVCLLCVLCMFAAFDAARCP